MPFAPPSLQDVIYCKCRLNFMVKDGQCYGLYNNIFTVVVKVKLVR